MGAPGRTGYDQAMMRWILGVVAGLALGPVAVGAPVELHYFWAPTCPDCAVMRPYLDALAEEFPELEIIAHEVAYSGENLRLMIALAETYGIYAVATPVVAVGEVLTVGAGLVAELRIREEVTRCVEEGCPSPLTRLPEPEDTGLGLAELLLIAVVAASAIFLLFQVLAR